MKLVSLKMSKKESKDQYEVKSDTMGYEEYPYGFRLHLNPKMTAKFPNLKDIKAGSDVTIMAKGRIASVNIEDIDGKKESDRNVSIQIRKINFSHADSDKEAFDEYADKDD